MCTLFFAAGHQFDFKNVWTFEELLVNLNIFQSYWTLVKKDLYSFCCIWVINSWKILSKSLMTEMLSNFIFKSF